MFVFFVGLDEKSDLNNVAVTLSLYEADGSSLEKNLIEEKLSIRFDFFLSFLMHWREKGKRIRNRSMQN